MDFDWTFGGAIPAPVLLLLGGVALWWGGDKLVASAAGVSRALRVPEHIIGAVVLGFGTSLPELLVCLSAALRGDPGIAIGNVVGSNIANVGLILGVAAVLAPVLVERKLRVVDLPLGLVVALGLFLWFRPDGGGLGGWAWAVLLAAFVAYLLTSLRAARAGRRATPREDGVRAPVGAAARWLLVGLVFVALGAEVFVDGATGTAAILNVPNEVIGLSLVALGTSLPELVTTVAAARQGHPELAVGNVAGSNVFNLLFVLGTTSAVANVPISARMTTDLAIMTGFAVLAFPFFWKKHRLGRTQGTVLLCLYAGYITWLFLQGRA